jgi:hypothetical protein
VTYETTEKRVQRLMGEAFAKETGGGECTWAYEPIGHEWTLHNPSARLAVKVSGVQLRRLVEEVDEIEWEERDTGRKLARFEGVSSGFPDAVYE